MPPLGKTNPESSQKKLGSFFRPYTVPKNVVRNEGKASLGARPPSIFAAFAKRSTSAPSIQQSTLREPSTTPNTARDTRGVQPTPKVSSSGGGNGLEAKKRSDLKDNILKRSRSQTLSSRCYRPIPSESHLVIASGFMQRRDIQDHDLKENPSIPRTNRQLSDEISSTEVHPIKVRLDAISPPEPSSHGAPMLPQGAESSSVVVKAKPRALLHIGQGKTNATIEVIDLTLSSSPVASSTVTSIETTRKRRRSSITSNDSFCSTASEPETKTRRTDSQPMQSYVPHRSQRLEKRSQAAVSPLPPSSSQLTVLSRTPSFNGRSVMNQNSHGSTQERTLIVQSSQSDENDEIEDMGTSFVEQVDGAVDEDESCSDSDSSIEGVVTLFSKRKHSNEGIITNSATADINPNKTSRVTRSQLTTATVNPKKRQAFVIPPKPIYKFSLDKLVKQNEHDLKAQIEIEKAKAAIAKEDETIVDEMENTSTGINLDHLHAVMNHEDDEDNVERLVLAMQRADVLETETEWTFFENMNHNEPLSPESMVFPSLGRQSKDLLKSLEDQTFREQAFLTGFANDVLSTCGIPEELLLWMWHSVLSEPRIDLSNAYIYALKNNHSILGRFLHPGRIRQLLEGLRAKPAAVNISYSIEPIQRPQNSTRRSVPPQLLRVVKVLGELAECLSSPSKTYCINILLRLCVSTDVANSGELQIATQQSLVSMFDSISENRFDDSILHIAESLYSALEDPILQHRLISSIPSNTYKTHIMKRNLALAFVLRDPLLLSCPLNDPTSAIIPSRIIKYLENSPRFSTTSSTTDYKALGALISLLDTAIDSGFSHIFPQPSPPINLLLLLQQQQAQHSPIDSSFPTPSHLATTTPDTDPTTRSRAQTRTKAENDFNTTIDALALPIRNLSRSVGDSGTSHMARNEAKGVAERLVERLEHAVRTKPKPKRGIWSFAAGGGGGGSYGGEGDGSSGGSGEGERSTWMEGQRRAQGERKVMEGWITRAKENSKTKMKEGEE